MRLIINAQGASWILNSSNVEQCKLVFYSSASYELIQTVTYESRSTKAITIKKPYSHLHINAQNNRSDHVQFWIFSMEMYHYFCNKTTKFNANLNKVDSSTANISRQFKCLNTATGSDGNSTIITVLCTPKGEWIATDQKCVCKKGFYFDNKQCSCKYIM